MVIAQTYLVTAQTRRGNCTEICSDFILLLFDLLLLCSVNYVQAASLVQASDHGCKQAVFLSDTLSLLQLYQNHMLPNLTKAKALQQVADTRRAVLQWIPAHCGISGNEQVDILAKEGARGERHANNVGFSEKKTFIRVLTMPRSQRDDYHLLSREQQDEWQCQIILMCFSRVHS